MIRYIEIDNILHIMSGVNSRSENAAIENIESKIRNEKCFCCGVDVKYTVTNKVTMKCECGANYQYGGNQQKIGGDGFMFVHCSCGSNQHFEDLKDEYGAIPQDETNNARQF